MITEDEKYGIEAIQYLQKMAGVNEPHDRALKNWRIMTEREKEITREYYNRFKK